MKLKGRGTGAEIVMLQFSVEILYYYFFAKNVISWKTVVSVNLFCFRRGSFGDPCLVIAGICSNEYTST